MIQYSDLYEYIIQSGEVKKNRTDIDTISVFGYQMRFNLNHGFPLLTTKYVNFEAVKKELLWFLRGETNINTLGCKIWDEWADENGELGPIYGKSWRDFGGCKQSGTKGIDQIKNVIESIKKTPNSRRHIVTAWNPIEIDNMALPPCHAMFQFYVSNNKFLNCQLYQRSADFALGVPFNIASYALLTHIIANECNLKPNMFIHTLGDAHIYKNHLDGLKVQMSRFPFDLPSININNKPWDKLKTSDISLVNYKYHPKIKFDVAV